MMIAAIGFVPMETTINILHGFDRHNHALEFDHLVFALGSVTNFCKIPGLEERAITMRSRGDAIDLRKTLIARLEEANPDCATNNREPLLTFVVVGGGFAGVETVGSIKDFLREALPFYPNLEPEMIRVVLVHPGDFVLPELGESLGGYASRKLAERGVELRSNTKVSKGVRDRAILATLLYHGMRREELCGLRVKDLHSRQGVMHFRIKGGSKSASSLLTRLPSG